jgi:hypothetical protein
MGRHRLLLKALSLLCAASSLAAFSTWFATAVVFTPGGFRVSESGAAVYEIPIKVPPGTAGMEPRLSLVYNSQQGNGVLGVGWSLSGLSAVTRCPRTLAQDGISGSVNYDWDDRFCLDGQRLIAIAGTYGQDGTEYRTERESFRDHLVWRRRQRPRVLHGLDQVGSGSRIRQHGRLPHRGAGQAHRAGVGAQQSDRLQGQLFRSLVCVANHQMRDWLRD